MYNGLRILLSLLLFILICFSIVRYFRGKARAMKTSTCTCTTWTTIFQPPMRVPCKYSTLTGASESDTTASSRPCHSRHVFTEVAIWYFNISPFIKFLLFLLFRRFPESENHSRVCVGKNKSDAWSVKKIHVTKNTDELRCDLSNQLPL